VLPAVVDLLRRLPHWVDGGAARLSLVSADALAGALAELALLPEPPHGQVLHAAHPEPVTARDLVTSIAHELGLPLPQGELTLDQALARLGATHDPVTRRRLSLLAVDHFYDSGRLWKLVDAPAGPGFPAAFPQYAPWYRGILGPR
jgi:nucleoside-diphosphate-sugar epimerase